MSRVRVPATRELIELGKAEEVRAKIKYLDETGRLPPKPPELENLSDDDILISIDPHQSIHAMPHLIREFGDVLGRMGYEIIVNDTEIDFVTSDNPVVYFDPRRDESLLRPYTLDRQDSAVELFFAIDPTHCLHGHSDLGQQFLGCSITYRHEHRRNNIKRINRFIVRFGYRSVYSLTKIAPAVIKHASQSPVGKYTHTRVNGRPVLLQQHQFGMRPKKPKWEETRLAAAVPDAAFVRDTPT